MWVYVCVSGVALLGDKESDGLEEDTFAEPGSSEPDAALYLPQDNPLIRVGEWMGMKSR